MMIDDVWVFDFEYGTLGIYSVKEDTFTAYHGEDIREATQQLLTVKEAVSYNGNRGFDRMRFNSLLNLPPEDPIPFEGKHTDMNQICWGKGILGSDLIKTYRENCPNDDYELISDPEDDESADQDCYMTFKLWECLQEGKLKDDLGIHLYSFD